MMRSRTVPLIIWLVLFPVSAMAQCPAPFVNALDRMMAFSGKRFLEVDARPPRQVHSMDGALLYVDYAGHLMHFDVGTGRHALLQRGPLNDLQVAGERAAWRVGDTLKVLRSGAARSVSTGVVRSNVTDSLVVFHDSLAQELAVLWRGQRIPLATIEQGSQRVQWRQGGNTVTFFDHAQRRVSLFQRGTLRTLTDSTDVGLVVNGTDIVGYWDDVRDEFLGEANGTPQRLSGMKPISAQAGNGILAFVDGTLKLKCWSGGTVHQLTDSMPAQYWVKDTQVLYLWRGRLMHFTPEGPRAVADHVPEQWEVSGDLIVYLDINRELRGWRNGKPLRFGNEANISTFQLFGGTVVYRSPTGPITIINDGRTYTF